MAASLGNAVGGVGGAMKYFEGRKKQKRGEAFLDNFQWRGLENPYESLQVSTLGADLQREEASRNTSTVVGAIREGGSRAIMGSMGKVQAHNNMVNRGIGANLDQQQKAIDFAAANDDVLTRGMEEKRQTDELQGYGQMASIGMQMKYAGIADMMNSGQAQGQTNQSIMSSVMGGMSGGMGGGGGEAPAPSAQYGGMASEASYMNTPTANDPNSASLYYGNYGVS